MTGGGLWVPSCTTCCLTTLVMHERDLCVGGKVMGGNFAEAPDGGVFGSEALWRVCYVTEAVNLLRILTRIA